MNPKLTAVVFTGLLIVLFTCQAAFGQVKQQTLDQITQLLSEKTSRTPAERKISSVLLQATREAHGKQMTAGVSLAPADVHADAAGNLMVDITGDATAPMLARIAALGGKIIYSSVNFNTIRAQVNLSKVNAIAGLAGVKFIKPASIAHIVGSNSPGLPGLKGAGPAGINGSQAALPGLKRPGFSQRAAKVKQQVERYLMALGAAAIDSVGDHAMGADSARAKYGYQGEGIRIGIISDSYNFLNGAASDITKGYLPGAGNPYGYSTPVTVVQDDLTPGSTDEGRAMLQIVHSLAPKAQLYFATADYGDASFAQYILALRAAPNNCDIIIDDVEFYDEPVFQDGLIAQAVNTVTASGALYFASAHNSGSKLFNTASAYEADFNDAGSLTFTGDSKTGTVHNFGTVASPLLGDKVGTKPGYYTLNWADPLGGSTNDYDLFLVNSSGTVISSSTDVQDGTQDPYEFIYTTSIQAGEMLVVFKAAAAQALAFNLNANLNSNVPGFSITTTGNTYGHSAAADAYSVAAASAAAVYPGVFTTSSKVETFSSDGPRRVFFNADTTAVTPGNFLFGTNGGNVRQKPDLTAADHVSTSVLNPFNGTSAAAPHAGAVAALLKSAQPSLTAAQIRTILTSTALDIEAAGVDINSGYGIVQAKQAMQQLNPAPAAPGNALQFDGSSQYVGVNTGTATISGSFTAEAWVKPASTTGVLNILSTRGPSDMGFNIQLEGGNNIHVQIGDGTNWLTASADAAFNYAAGTWYHIACVVTPAGYTIYANGESVGTGAFSGTPLLVNASHSITLGVQASNNLTGYFNGNMDEVRVYNAALSKANIQADMHSAAVALPASLKLYYNFDLQTGATTVNDLSGNNYAGTINGTAPYPFVESYAMVIPTATAATKVSSTGFAANWGLPETGTVNNYLLDVATDAAFTSIVTGYNQLAVATVSQNVTGLTPNTTYYYRVRANKTTVAGQGGFSETIPVTTVTAITWTGTASTDWNTAANWNTNAIPTATTDVTVPSGTPHSPAVNTTNAIAHSITNSNTLSVAAGGVLSIAGDVNNSSVFDASAGALVFNGATPQQVAGSITVNNLTINNASGVAITSGSTKVYGVYTPTAGTLTTNGNLVLASTATGTASVAASTVSNYVTGNVTVERYIPAHRAWRLLTAPLSNTGTVYANWQNNGVATGTTGALIFSPTGTGGSGNGFTAGGGEASVESYDPVANNWVPLSNTNFTLLSAGTGTSAANTGYSLFITGPFGSNNILPATGATATTLRAAGSLQTGTQQLNYSGLAAGAYILVGNPYASPIDFTQVGIRGTTGSNNINGTMWAWDAKRGNTSYGGYVTFSLDKSNGVYDRDFPPDSTQQTIAIQSGESFFVEAVNSGSATVTINESDKAAASTITGGVFGVQPPATPAQQLRISLNNSTGQVDGVLAKFGDVYKAGVSDDAAKLFNYDENLSLRIDTNYLAIERRPIPAANDTIIYLDAYAMKKNTAYSFTVSPQNMPTGLQAWLVDAYTKTKTVLSMAGSTTVGFNTGTDAGSLSETRFTIVFQTNGVLATATTLKAVAAGASVQVEWATPNELGVKQYQVQRSADAQNFATINTETARNSGNKEVYDFTDAQPNAGDNYYRTKISNSDGTITYSNVALVKMQKGSASFSIYPNPTAHNGQLHAQFNNMAAGKYTLLLYSTIGKQLMSKLILLDGTTTLQTVSLPQGIAKGSYRIVLLDGNGGEWKQQLVVQ